MGTASTCVPVPRGVRVAGWAGQVAGPDNLNQCEAGGERLKGASRVRPRCVRVYPTPSLRRCNNRGAAATAGIGSAASCEPIKPRVAGEAGRTGAVLGTRAVQHHSGRTGPFAPNLTGNGAEALRAARGGGLEEFPDGADPEVDAGCGRVVHPGSAVQRCASGREGQLGTHTEEDGDDTGEAELAGDGLADAKSGERLRWLGHPRGQAECDEESSPRCSDAIRRGLREAREGRRRSAACSVGTGTTRRERAPAVGTGNGGGDPGPRESHKRDGPTWKASSVQA